MKQLFIEVILNNHKKLILFWGQDKILIMNVCDFKTFQETKWFVLLGNLLVFFCLLYSITTQIWWSPVGIFCQIPENYFRHVGTFDHLGYLILTKFGFVKNKYILHTFEQFYFDSQLAPMHLNFILNLHNKMN